VDFCLESEPAGEICVGELFLEDIELLKKLYKTDKMIDSVFYTSICHLNGVFTDLDGGEFSPNISPTYTLYKELSLDNLNEDDDIDEEERFFLIYTSLTKQSKEFEYDGQIDDESKLVVEYTSFDFDYIETDLYGYLVGNIITSISYDDEVIEEFYDAELLESSDLTREIYILQKKGIKSSIIYSNVDYDDEKWGEFIK
jgi:hypothetical protein